MTNGILLIALGHRFYGELAANLACSIKCSCDLPIHLVHDGTYNLLSDSKKRLFDSVSEMPKEYSHRAIPTLEPKTNNPVLDTFGEPVFTYKFTPFKSKTYLDKLSPFDNTLFLDVDLLLFTGQDLKVFFAELNALEQDFTIENWGPKFLSEAMDKNQGLWANEYEIMKAYGFEGKYMPVTHSELVYFRKGTKVFDYAREAYENPKCKTLNFAGDVADEFAFNVALTQLDMKPHIDNWCPIYWQGRKEHVNVKRSEIHKKFIGISLAGNKVSEFIKGFYNQMVLHTSKRMQVQQPFKYVPKSKWLKERQSL